MARKESSVTKIGRLTSKRFPSLSGSGPGMEILVRYILSKQRAIERAQRQKIGDDVRDYMNTSYFIRRLSGKALGKIIRLKRNKIRKHLRSNAYPFSRLNKKTRETLLHLPNSWIYGSANWLLQTRKTRLRRSYYKITAD